MNKYRSNISLILHRTSFIGLLVISLTVFFFLTKSAEMQSSFVSSDSVSSEQNLVNGRLVFTSTTFAMFGITGNIVTANADGSGGTAVPISVFLPTQTTWSADGTKILYVAGGEIGVVNAGGGGEANLTSTSSALESNPSWSIAGKIAYQRDGQIWVMNTDGSGQTQFSGITQPASSYPAWSPDGTKLAFSSGGEIWKINADGTNEQRVTTNATTDVHPDWSPDGSKIVFAKGNDIAIVNADGTSEITLTSGNTDSQPVWSPDGTKIAFRRGNENRGIYTMDTDGANQIRIIADSSTTIPNNSTVHENPAWQPFPQTPNTFIISGRVTYSTLPMSGATVNLSGTTNASATTDAVGNYQFSGLPPGGNYTVSPSFPRYYFTPANRSFNNLASNQTGNNFEVLGVCRGGTCLKNGKIAFSRSSDIFTINPDGTSQTNITNNAAGNGAPNYSPDGSNIIFNTNRDGNTEIYRMDANGSNPARLTNNAASDFSPYYSPDGASIVFVSDRDGNYEIYKMNADGSNQVRLTNNTSTDYQPAFSPDGQKIIFVSIVAQTPTKLFTMNADGSNPQPLPDPGGFSPVYERPSYSPDGSKIIFTYTPDASTQIRVNWTMNSDGTNRARFPADGSYGTYSPDGTKVTYTCCIFDNTNRLFTSNADGSFSSARNLTPSNTGNTLPDWQPLPAPRPAPFDFDGDGRSDVSVFRQSDRIWYLLRSHAGIAGYQWGLSTDTLAPADYDGDLRTDVAVWRSSDGNFYLLNSFDNTVRIENFGLNGDVPTGGDFDGDGKSDLAIYRGGAQGVFYYRASMGNPSGNITVIPWGTSGDKAVAGDYDGDGRTDAAVYRPSSGVWYVRKSSDGQMLANAFGLAGDTLVPADYDADGKTDLAVYRGGVWYVWRSSQGITVFQYGLSKDIPAPADYDGDGRADAAIYRNGAWWILKTQTGVTEITNFGISDDIPIPAAYVR